MDIMNKSLILIIGISYLLLVLTPAVSAENQKVDFTISTHPQGAHVSITSERGTKSGTTPVTFKVLPDTYSVSIKDSQGRAHISTVNVGESGKVLTIELEPSSEPAVPEATLTFEEQIADAVFLETNAVRLENGLPPLQRDENIDAIVQPHAIYMASINDSNHDNVEERVDQLNELGYGWVAENCAPARSGTQSDYCDHKTHTVVDTPEGIAEFAVHTLVVHDWCEPMNDGHRTNILNPHYTHIGIGVAKGDSYYYIAQDFGGV